uniref:NADH-ubiquinone oxidoreductase chain 4L n=1 Tax=Aphrodita australis TaxID=2715517 RepID=A0A6G7IXU2_9ANNE|nr:NADH dehydrogenase subunit 4L [Aphrodita australis]QII43120.1 NADH dehydrogenase subunit 4L [Aphrodita australis]
MAHFSFFLMPFATISSLICLVIQRQHLLMALLALETMILTLTITTMMIYLTSNPMEPFMMMILLTFGACEASLGLACLISMTRSYGNDLINSLSINKC